MVRLIHKTKRITLTKTKRYYHAEYNKKPCYFCKEKTHGIFMRKFICIECKYKIKMLMQNV
jgi:hypothetical protein